MNAESSITMDSYIKSFPEKEQTILEQLRSAIKNAAPEAQETISYGIPTFKLKGKALVHFGAFKKHIGFYATPTGHGVFAKELSVYKQGKGSVQFPYDQPLPFDLIDKIVKFRISEMPKN